MHRSKFKTDNNAFHRMQNNERIRELSGIESGDDTKTSAKQWIGLKSFTVIQTIQEAVNTISVRMRPADGSSLCLFTPGELKLCISFKTPEGIESSQVYSVTSRPNGVYYQITNRRLEPNHWTNDSNTNRNGISYDQLCTLSKGSTIKAQPIFGPSLLSCGDKSRVAVFLTSGRGLISVIPLLPTAIKERPRVALFHEDLEVAVHPFGPYLENLIPQSNPHNGILTIFYTSPNFMSRENHKDDFVKHGTLTSDAIFTELQASGIDAKSGADYYICGDGSDFSRSIAAQLRDNGVKSCNVFREDFGPFASP
jgi:nitric oxide dioxygenase